MRSEVLLLLFLAGGAAAAAPAVCIQDARGCTQCHPDGKRCVECELGFVLKKGVCRQCTAKMHDDGVVCAECNPKRLGRCTKCFYWYDPDFATYPTKDGGCALSPIKNCNRAHTHSGRCFECMPSYFLKDGRCVNCPDGCSECNSRGQCTKCYSGGLVKGRCFKCADKHCERCDGNTAVCKKCELNYGVRKGKCRACLDEMCSTCLYNGACTRCLSGFAPVRGRCKKCTDPSCVSCPSKPRVCEACDNGLSTDPATGRCIQCALPDCAACETSNAASCNTCELGFNRVAAGKPGIFKCVRQLKQGS